MPHQHEQLAGGGWQKLSLIEQLGNIGSEVGRAAKWRGQDEENFRQAAWRALELFDLTIRDVRWRGRLKEILRAREFFCGALLGGDTYKTTLSDLDRYFFQYAAAARLKK